MIIYFVFFVAFVFYIWLAVNTFVGLNWCKSITYLSKRQQQVGLAINIYYSNDATQLKLVSKLHANTSSPDVCC